MRANPERERIKLKERESGGCKRQREYGKKKKFEIWGSRDKANIER